MPSDWALNLGSEKDGFGGSGGPDEVVGASGKSRSSIPQGPASSEQTPNWVSRSLGSVFQATGFLWLARLEIRDGFP